jgi:site-specific DNA recombinase
VVRRRRAHQQHWINSAPSCRFPNECALANKISHPRNVYLREDAFDAQVTGWLATALAPGRLDQTIDQMTAAQPTTDDSTAAEAAETKIADANLKMARYKAALEVGGDPAEINTGSPRRKHSGSRLRPTWPRPHARPA